MASLSQMKVAEPRVGTIAAPFDAIDRLAEQAPVRVSQREHLRVIENREGTA